LGETKTEKPHLLCRIFPIKRENQEEEDKNFFPTNQK
jgi:hypothetical protein